MTWAQVFAAISIAACMPCLADEPIKPIKFGVPVTAFPRPLLSTITSTFSVAQAGTKPTTSQSGTERSNVSLQGTEKSECGPNEQQLSEGTATSEVNKLEESETSVTLLFSAFAFAQGGHYETCVACAGSACVGKHGEDTKAAVGSTSAASVIVRFDSAAEPADYTLSIVTSEVKANNKSSGPASFVFEVRDNSNNLITSSSQSRNIVIVEGGPGRLYRIDMRLDASANHEGIYLPKKMEGQITATVDVARAPILEAQQYRIGLRMVNGAPEKGFPSVGLIAIRDRTTGENRPHCTGTVIGDKTILTAAHCVVGYENREMRFLTGWDNEHPDADLAIESFDYPDNEEGFSYNNSTFADDLAVLYLRDPLSANIPRARLHAGAPAIESVEKDDKPMTFVGFGAYYGGPNPSAIGKKRRLDLKVTNVQSRTFDNVGIGSNTCIGDSGGPAILEADSGRPIVAGVISKGDSACLLRGTNTRVDTYAAWILPRQK